MQCSAASRSVRSLISRHDDIITFYTFAPFHVCVPHLVSIPFTLYTEGSRLLGALFSFRVFKDIPPQFLSWRCEVVTLFWAVATGILYYSQVATPLGGRDGEKKENRPGAVYLLTPCALAKLISAHVTIHRRNIYPNYTCWIKTHEKASSGNSLRETRVELRRTTLVCRTVPYCTREHGLGHVSYTLVPFAMPISAYVQGTVQYSECVWGNSPRTREIYILRVCDNHIKLEEVFKIICTTETA